MQNNYTKVPLLLGCEVVREIDETDESVELKTIAEKEVFTSDQLKHSDSYSKDEKLFKITDLSKFIDIAFKILSESSGKHEEFAIELTHTKMSGPSRASINSLISIQSIIG